MITISCKTIKRMIMFAVGVAATYVLAECIGYTSTVPIMGGGVGVLLWMVLERRG